MSLPLLRQFQRLCGSELRMVALRSLCVRRIGRYLLGETGGVLDDSAARTSRLAVPLERETPKGQHIYCVLAANTRKDVPVPWYLDGLCYPGQEDEKGYGRWLCQTFGLPNEETEQGRPSAPFPPDGADLLERAAQGSCSLGEVLTGFEAPDLLDSAVMLGQTETVRALIDTPGEAERLGLTAAELEAALETMSEPEGSVTLCSAGRRLWRAPGPGGAVLPHRAAAGRAGGGERPAGRIPGRGAHSGGAGALRPLARRHGRAHLERVYGLPAPHRRGGRGLGGGGGCALFPLPPPRSSPG